MDFCPLYPNTSFFPLVTAFPIPTIPDLGKNPPGGSRIPTAPQIETIVPQEEQKVGVMVMSVSSG